MNGRFGGDRGSSIITFLILAPMMVMFLELIVLGGRVATTNADVQSAAREAARQASLANGPGSAPLVINPAVAVALGSKGFRCQSPSAIVGPGTNFVPGGVVEVEVTCTVQLSDLDLLSIPGSITITKIAAEPIDRFRVVD